MKIGPDDPEQRREIEIRNLGEIDENFRWLEETRPGFAITKTLVLEIHKLTIQRAICPLLFEAK